MTTFIEQDRRIEHLSEKYKSVLLGRRSSRRRLIVVASVVVLAVIAGLLWSRRRPRESQSAERFATVQRAPLTRSLRVHGVVEAVQSFSVAAPRLQGGTWSLVITHLASTGTVVKKGDLLAEFDRQTQIRNALDREAEYRDLQEQIARKRAEQASILTADQVELTAAEHAVSSAQLELRRNEVVSAIDAEKNRATLEQAKATFSQLRDTFELKRRAAKAELRVLEIQRDRSLSVMRHSQENSEKLSIKSPISGTVVLNTIWKSNRMAEVQEGDEVRTGMPFLQVVNPGMMQVRARINQADVDLLREGMTTLVSLDAYPGLSFPGKIERIAAVGQAGGFSETVRTYSVIISIQGSDTRLMPDLSAAVDIELDRGAPALVIPRDAILNDGGKHFVFVKAGNALERRAVSVGAMNDTDIVVTSGLAENESVLRDAAARVAKVVTQ